MEAYPPTLTEFERRFATEADCRAYLVRLRWLAGRRLLRLKTTTSRGWLS